MEEEFPVTTRVDKAPTVFSLAPVQVTESTMYVYILDNELHAMIGIDKEPTEGYDATIATGPIIKNALQTRKEKGPKV